MKITMKLGHALLLVLSLVLMVSCEGDQGEIGPRGIQGEPGRDGVDGTNGVDGSDGQDGQDGVDGQNGQDGENGEDGADGNANVIASDWFGPTDQYFTVNGYARFAEFNREVPELTTAIIENGTILVYAKLPSIVPDLLPTGHISQLPLQINPGNPRNEWHFAYFAGEGNLKIRLTRLGSATPATYSFSSSHRFRYIIIPANIASTTGKTAIDYTQMNYEELTTHFNLKP
ncbi:collagen-like protein [Sediminicola luteus]|uniref:Collagen-like protein n=1 Tax=Sediminicola luteus TaxID=319238 RepID=A0A2A4GCN3_9FLAO|nr:collagen-like protein [Sediminicola luteus]PCE65734.1 hypothetical protein B7P33_00050 [Sediminicola luteus]